jgi:hypothetical protein
MGDDILRSMSSQFSIATDGPYPSAVDMASDQLWDLISSHGSHSGDASVVEADHELVTVTVEDHDSDEYSLEVVSHLLGLGDSPSTDSGMSLIVNLGTAKYAKFVDCSRIEMADCPAPKVLTVGSPKEMTTQNIAPRQRTRRFPFQASRSLRTCSDCRHRVPRKTTWKPLAPFGGLLEQLS